MDLRYYMDAPQFRKVAGELIGREVEILAETHKNGVYELKGVQIEGITGNLRHYDGRWVDPGWVFSVTDDKGAEVMDGAMRGGKLGIRQACRTLARYRRGRNK